MKTSVSAKSTALLLAFLLCLAALPAFAQESASPFYQSLPEGMRALITKVYPGWAAPYGALLYGDQSAALVMLQKDGLSVAAVAERADDGYAFVAVNDRLVPQGVTVDTQSWWIQDKNDDGRPYIWYEPDDRNGFYYDLARDADGTWRVVSGSFGDTAGFSENTLCFDVTNGGTALRVCSESYFSAVCAPLNVDLSFSAFDPEVVRAACAEAMTREDEPMLIPSTLEADALPQGRVIDFPKGEQYPVYSGPGKDYRRLGDEQNAVVSTNGWIQVFGREGDWLLIQYNVGEGRNRFGYITADALPDGVTVNELNFTRKAGVLDGTATDDPLRTWAESERFDDVDCVQLATFGDEAYVEIVTDAGKYRGFVTGVTLREDHADDVVTAADGASLYADEALTDEIGFVSGGVVVEVAQCGGTAARVRVGTAACAQEGWVRADALLTGALVSDVNAAAGLVVLCAPQTDNYMDHYGYAAPSADAERLAISDDPCYRTLAKAEDFLLVQSDDYNAVTAFVPSDWAVPLPQGSVYEHGLASVTLTRDAAVTVNPDPASRQTILLYQGTTVGVAFTDDGCLTVDGLMLPVNASVATYGYLPGDALQGQPDASLAVGLLVPADGTDCRILTDNRGGSAGGTYGYGTRLILLGETETSYLVRTPGGEYGFFNKADVTPAGLTASQEDYASLAYGTAALAGESFWQRPYAQAGRLGGWEAGARVEVLGNLGSWWCVWKDYQTAFLPTELLTGLPDGAPVYAGVCDAFRAEPFAYTWGNTPPMFFTDTDAWLLLKNEDGVYLSHRTRESSAWVETDCAGPLLGKDLRVINGFDGDGDTMTIAVYLNDGNAETTFAFARGGEGWRLVSARIREYGNADSYGSYLLYDRLFTVADGGLTLTEEGRTRFLPLSQACETDLARLDAGALCAQCRQAYGQAGLSW